METTVGIRELKDHLSAILENVRRGTSVTITYRRRAVARLVLVRNPAGPDRAEEALWQAVASGRLAWNGGKPPLPVRPSVNPGPAVSDAVLEDRR